MKDANQSLKDSILTQIAIFEQYLKVAVLQNKALKKDEAAEKKMRYGIAPTNKSNLLQNVKDWEFDDKSQKSQFIDSLQKQKRGKSLLTHGRQGSTMMIKKDD